MPDLLGSANLRDQITASVIDSMLGADLPVDTIAQQRKIGEVAADVADEIFRGVIERRASNAGKAQKKSASRRRGHVRQLKT